MGASRLLFVVGLQELNEIHDRADEGVDLWEHGEDIDDLKDQHQKTHKVPQSN